MLNSAAKKEEIKDFFHDCSEQLDLPLAEGVHDGGEDDQENTTSGTKTKDLVDVRIYVAVRDDKLSSIPWGGNPCRERQSPPP